MSKPILTKKAILTALILLAFSPARAVDLGVKAGASLSLLTMGNGHDAWEKKLSWQGGIALALPLGRSFCFAPEIMLAGYRSQLDIGFEGASVLWTYSRKQLQLPVLFRWLPLARKTGWQPVIMFGPFIAYSFDSAVTLAVEGVENEIDMKDKLAKNDFGFMGGAGVEVPLGPGKSRLTAEIRYILATQNQSRSASFASGKIRQNAVVFLTGISF